MDLSIEANTAKMVSGWPGSDIPMAGNPLPLKILPANVSGGGLCGSPPNSRPSACCFGEIGAGGVGSVAKMAPACILSLIAPSVRSPPGGVDRFGMSGGGRSGWPWLDWWRPAGLDQVEVEKQSDKPRVGTRPTLKQGALLTAPLLGAKEGGKGRARPSAVGLRGLEWAWPPGNGWGRKSCRVGSTWSSC